MKEQFCTYKISLKLKELGFNEECFGYYCYAKSLIFDIENKDSYKYKLKAPLWQQAWKFILNKLDEYSLCSAIKIFDDDSCVLYYLDTEESFDTQEQAIIYAIQIIEQNGN